MKCNQCGFENPEGFGFCGRCGASLGAVCPHCGFDNPPGFKFCGKCGQSLGGPPPGLSQADIDHLRTYLPPTLVEALQFEMSAPSVDLLTSSSNHLLELLKAVTTHLPSYLIEQISQDPRPGQVDGRFVVGTLLFADISGFTAMSEKLSRIGREGAEEITAIVNRYFTTMLGILRNHNGHLIKFGGDALLGLFLEPDSATRAAQTACRMQLTMSDFSQTKTSQGTFPLRMKVGLRRGRFFSAQVGNVQSMEYALFGSDVNATAATEGAAVAGQVLMNPASVQAISLPHTTAPLPDTDDYVLIQEITPAPQANNAPTSTLPCTVSHEPSLENLRHCVALMDTIKPYLPAGLLNRIARDPHAAGLEGEHRLVAVLFANFEGLDQLVDRLGPGHEETITTALNTYFTTMAQAIHRFGGVVNKIDLYDHGNKLLVFFGAPLAHEDDAERAVRAAMAMQEAFSGLGQSIPAEAGLPDLKLTQRIGISYGYVFAGYVGTSWRREYTVMGDEVNLAARLMSVSEAGHIVVSSNVRRKIQALFEFENKGEVRLKGKSAPVPIFAVSGERAIPESLRGLKGMRSALVGRDKEWKQMMAALNKLLLGQGQIVSVIGEAGLGKSRLIDEMRHYILDADLLVLRWIEGHCLSYTETVSYRPFQEIVRRMMGLKAEEGPWESWNYLRETLEKQFSPEQVVNILPYLANFLGIPVESSLQEKVRYLDAEALQRRTFLAISAIIEAQTRRHNQTTPLVLALEDIHWLDQASLALLQHLMPLVNRVPLMLLLIYRPEKEKACWVVREKAAREFSHCTTEVALSQLPNTDSETLLDNLVDISDNSEQVRQLILSRAEGNPLYLEEVIRVLIDNGTLVKDEHNHWHISGTPDSIQVPDTLQGVIMTRLDRLEEPCRWTAQIASVIGRVFSFDVLDHIITTEMDNRLNYCLVQLQQHELAHETQRTPELIYSFTHTMTQEVGYHSLLARRRRLYHRKIAAYLEAAPSASVSKVESHYPLIAHHAFLGQDWQRALKYQILTGQQAQKLFANHDAIDHFQKALQSAETLNVEDIVSERLTSHLALGELLVTTGQYDDALPHLSAAHALAMEHNRTDVQARACRWLARLYELRGEYPPAFDWIQQGLVTLAGKQTAEAAELLLIAGLINTRQGDYDNALSQVQSSMEIARKLDEITALARSYNLQGHISRLRGHSTVAIEHFQQALVLYERAGDINGQALAHNQIANAYFDMGQWRKASTHYYRAREIFSQTGDVYNNAIANNNLGGIALNQGHLNKALSFYQDGLQLLKSIGGSIWIQGVFHMNLGATYIRQKDITNARKHLNTSREYFEQAQSRDFLPEMHRHFAEAALQAADFEAAETHANQALDLARELSMRGEEGICLRILSEITMAQNKTDHIEDRLQKSLTILKEAKDEYGWAQSHLVLAKWYFLQNNPEAGRESLDACLPIFQRLDAALDLTAAHELQQV